MTLDGPNRATTALAGGLVIAGAAVTRLPAHGNAAAAGLASVMPFLLFAILALAWAYSPREIVIDGHDLWILRRAWTPFRVPLASITDASRTARLGADTIRLFGVGGFFGSFGLFRNSALGRFHAFATRRDAAIVVRRQNGLPIVMTPDDLAGALAALQSSRQGAGRDPAR